MSFFDFIKQYNSCKISLLCFIKMQTFFETKFYYYFTEYLNISNSVFNKTTVGIKFNIYIS